MKSTLLLILGLFISITVFNEPVSVLSAKKAAQKQYKTMAEKNKLLGAVIPELSLAVTYTNASFKKSEQVEPELDLIYVFNASENNGFVIISADDRALPVIGYALKGTFTGEEIPPALTGLLERRAQEIEELIKIESEPVSQVKSSWNSLLETGAMMKYKSFTAVDPLISTTWDQAPYYNDLCPYDNNYNELTVTGCPATAMAQIMKFWNYPANGTSYHSYNTESYGTLSANFEATSYDWTNMPNSLNGSNNAIATLMFHCGVSVEMQYGVAETGGSGGYVIEAQSPIQHCCEYAFKTYFGYKSTLQGLFRESYNDATWIQMLKADLDAGRPIQYAGFGQGGGHTWVCDGYDNNNNFHMNWGWSGTYDGYYSLDQLSPGTGGAGGGSGSFNSGQQALLGIEPAGGGGGGGGSQFDLRAYSQMYVDPFPINFANAFDVSMDIINFDESNFSGSLAAALFNEQGDFVDFIEQLSGISLLSGYDDTYIFHTDGMLATPGTYYIGIYYKSGSSDWAMIGAGNYTNYASVQIIGPPNDMQMYSPIDLNPVNIVSNESFQITFDIGNYGSQSFSGLVSADLYDSEGNYLGELESTDFNLPSGYYDGIQFNCPGVDVPAGSYILAIWDTPDGENWTLVGSDDFPNPITIQIAEPQLPGDVYENNDDIEHAYQLPLNIPGSQVVIKTDGSNIHTGNDLDYFKIDLPSGFQYKITPRTHDSYNSGNGITYTDDVLWAFGAGGNWTEVYDDILDGYFVMEGGQTVFFVVSNYYQGQTGTYLLEILIEKGTFGTEEYVNNDKVTLYPNPASGSVTLSSMNWNTLPPPLEIQIVDLTGRVVYRKENLNPEIGLLQITLPEMKEGVYHLRLAGQKGFIDKKLVIKK